MRTSPAPPAHQHTDWHTLAVSDVLQKLNCSDLGLAPAEAQRRLSEYGPNELQLSAGIPGWRILLSQFQNALIVILLIAIGISAYLGHTVEAITIAVIVLFAVVLGFVQEFRAERALEKLRDMAAPSATVLRNQQEMRIPARELVPGDVIMLRAGDRVPADARVMRSVNLRLEEAALTGESMPVEKAIDALSTANLPIGDRRNLVFGGTTVVNGRGSAVIVATGLATEFGKVARLLQSVETRRTPLQENLDQAGKRLAQVAGVIVLAIVAAGLARGEAWIEMLIFGIALAVAVVPEALPMVVTISLAIGVQAMVRRHALIRRLPAVETLGCVSVICSDKTGTLTRDEMTVRQVAVAGRVLDITGVGYAPEGAFLDDVREVKPDLAVELLAGVAALACDAELLLKEDPWEWEIQGDPTEGALVVLAAKAGIDKRFLEERYPRCDELPFTSESKRMITVHGGRRRPFVCAKGAPEVLLNFCSRIVTSRGTQRLDTQQRALVLRQAQGMAGRALRILAVAVKPNATLAEAEQGLILVGLVGMQDPPRPEAREAIEKCRRAGIKPVMITGDHPLTAQAIAADLGLLERGRAVTGTELDSWDEAALLGQIAEISVFARVSPEHKLRVVSALQNLGHTVAMTGDGVNDAPALKRADIGIAMGITGTDVSKEAADMTLTDDNFASIVAAVEEGRAIFSNIKKYLMYLLSSNIGEIGLMSGAALVGLPLPLSAVQILYVNLATDGLPALALAVDPPEPDLMERSPRDPRAGIFTRPVVMLMLLGGCWSASINLSMFAWYLHSGHTESQAMTLSFVTLVLTEFFKAYEFRSEFHSAFRRALANRWLNLAILWELGLLGLILYLPFLQHAFGTVGPSHLDLLVASGCAVSIIPVLEIAKIFTRKSQRHAQRKAARRRP